MLLFEAARRGDQLEVERLLKLGVDVDERVSSVSNACYRFRLL